MNHCFTLLLVLLSVMPLARAEPTRPPRQLIEGLGLEVRQLLEDDKPGRTPEDAERAVAEQIAELIRSSPGHPALTDPDLNGQTPLMLAASGAYPLVVQALLADPNVKLQINAVNKAGETAWMLARFAPTLTLLSCQPGVLTTERALFLPPYLRRMAHLLKTQGAAPQSVIRSLETAGAEAAPEAAKRAWLARCPNASPGLRQALADGPLTSTLIKESMARQRDFNAALRDRPTSIPDKPPQTMRFVQPSGAMRVVSLVELMAHGDLACPIMSKLPPPVFNSRWSGRMVFKVTASTRAGVLETVDLDLISRGEDEPAIVDAFRNAILSALSGYRCAGDHDFEQQFVFQID